MLSAEQLTRFNTSVERFNVAYPKKAWSEDFKKQLKNNFTYYSNKLEGTDLGYGDTIAYLQGQFIEGRSIRDLADLQNHHEILQLVFDNYNTWPITTATIKELHAELMKDPEQWDEAELADPLVQPGEYRRQVRTGNRNLPGENYDPANVKEYIADVLISGRMKELTEGVSERLNNKDLGSIDRHPLYIVADFHNQFLNDIHPFDNGNGRTFRLLQATIFMKEGYPPVVEQDRERYIKMIVACEDQASPLPMMELFMANISARIDRPRLN